ncbi:MAG: hypothetical protein ACYCVG_10940 [Leptospirillum sp.]
MFLKTKASSNVNIKIQILRNLSIQHLLGAAHFSRMCYQIDQENQNNLIGDYQQEITQLVIGSVTLSVAYLESYINELLFEGEKKFPDIKSEVVKSYLSLLEDKRILEKFDHALILYNALPFNKGDTTYQNIDAVISLRNGFIHFKPEWHDVPKKHKSISDKLKKKFKPCRFKSEDEEIFPMGCMTHSCSEWTVKSVIEFIDKFEDITGKKKSLDNIRNQLKTKP